MNEQNWLACTDPQPMLGFLWTTASRRKRALLNCGCLRQHWEQITDTETREAIEQAERLADGVGEKPNAPILRLVQFPKSSFGWCIDPKHSGRECGSLLRNLRDALAWHSPEAVRNDVKIEVQRVQSHMIRCIFGNPFRPVVVDPAWLTSDVISVAETIYNERAFGRLTDLADSLEQVGCCDTGILAHCRSNGSHVRGCWVVDLILGKQ
jgi:hypothetical protein